MPAHTYLQSDDEDIAPNPLEAPPTETAPPPPTNVWATLALQAGALRDIADGCKLLGVPAPPRLVTLLLREMTEGLAGPDPLSADFDWGEVPGGERPVRTATGRWRIVESRPDVVARYWYTDNATTASVCHAAGYEVRSAADGT